MLDNTLAQKYKQAGKKMFAASIFRKVNIWQQKSYNREMGNKIQNTNMMKQYTDTK